MQQEAGIPLTGLPDGWNVHEHQDSVAPALAAAGKFNLPDITDRLRMPILVATGDHDPNLTSSRDLTARVPQAELEVMENVGHGSVLQRPDLTTRLFLDFVGPG